MDCLSFMKMNNRKYSYLEYDTDYDDTEIDFSKYDHNECMIEDKLNIHFILLCSWLQNELK